MPRHYYCITFCLVLLIGLTAFPGVAQINGSRTVTLSGTVRDAGTGEVLIGAAVLVPATQQGTATLLDGTYQLRGVAAGTALVMRAQSLGYAPQELTVTVQVGAPQKIDFKLAATGRTLGEVTVAGQLDRESDASVRRTEQKADNVLNIISARAIELSPDVTVGNVVQRASGVSVVRNSSGDGQYAIIRGMDPRYNYTLVNGIKIPSPDARNRYVPLDIFPAELLERLEVVKALTPNMEGDAIGGAMNLVMKSAPDHLVLAATASTGYSDLFAQRAFSGFDTGGRVSQSPSEQRGLRDVAAPDDFSKGPLNYVAMTPVNALLGLTLGNRTKNQKLGFLVAGSYQRTFRGSNSLYYRPLGQPKPEPKANTFTFDELQRREYSALQTRVGLHAKLDYVFNPRHRLSLYSVLVQLDEAQHRHYSVNGDLGIAGDVPVNDRSRFRRQRLFNETIQGDHTLAPRLVLNWSGVYSLATGETPGQVDAGYKTSNGPNTPKGVFLTDIQHLWTHNRDQDWAGYFNLSYALTDHLGLSAGGLARAKDRSNYYNYYDLIPVTNGTGDQQPFAGYGQAQYTFKLPSDGGAKTTDGNNYTATETVVAGYVQAKLLLTNKLHLVGGVRAERTSQQYDSQVPPTQEGKTGRYNYLDLLPSAHVKYGLDERQNVRLSYFKGISRPTFYELVPAVIAGEDYDERGNPRLRHTQADNVDLRYENFGPAGAQLLGGVFYKRLVDPIERGFARVGNNSYYYQPNNYGNATNYGAELVVIKYVRNWGVSGNYTYTHSAITTPKRVYYRSATGSLVNAGPDEPTLEYPSSPTQTRPLQGQSDHIANLSLLYRSERLGFNGQLATVFTGRRINIVSPYKDLDQWQRATTQLDVSAEQRLPGHLVLFAKVTNLLNTPIILEVLQAPDPALLTLPEQTRADRTLVQRDEFNRTYQLGLRYRLN